MPTTYPTELKVKTIRRYEKGESIKALSQELHISQSTLYNWRKEYCSIKTPNRTYTPAVYLCRKSSPPLRNSIIGRTILLASMNCVMPLMWQGEPSTTASSVKQTEASIKRNKLNSC